jgi:membrane protein YqaA with SNARE-associated domain
LVAGGLNLPFWRCLLWMAIGKLARYAVLVWVVLAI